MKCFIGLGSNLGHRLNHLEEAGQKLRQASLSSFRASPVFSTPALIPPGAPESWRISYLNAVVEMEWQHSPEELLQFLKLIEYEMGRFEKNNSSESSQEKSSVEESSPAKSARWSPRVIDLDILSLGDKQIETANLKIPHQEIQNRAFVLDPLKHLVPSKMLVGSNENILTQARLLAQSSPVFMGIVNLTPDSFSDGNHFENLKVLQNKIETYILANIGILDFGAESTRPGATFVHPTEEWKRLEPALQYTISLLKDRIFKPQISVDTRNAFVAAKAIELGADIINDVSGGSDPEMISVLKHTKCDYIFMHSLCVPADPKKTLSPGSNTIQEIHQWAENKILEFTQAGIDLDRLIFDPGLGFGKTAEQSFTLLRHMKEFLDLPVRILVGHSRKSFLNRLTDLPFAERDWESAGISLQLAQQGVDILRVHEAHHHARCYRSFQEIQL